MLQNVLQQLRNVAGNQVAGNPRRRPRMIVTKHPVVRSTKSKKAKSRKSLELDSDDGVELEFGDVDKTPSRKEYSRSTCFWWFCVLLVSTRPSRVLPNSPCPLSWIFGDDQHNGYHVAVVFVAHRTWLPAQRCQAGPNGQGQRVVRCKAYVPVV